MFGVKQTVKVTQHNQVRGKQWQKFLSVKHHYNLLLHSHQQQQQKNRIFFSPLTSLLQNELGSNHTLLLLSLVFIS